MLRTAALNRLRLLCFDSIRIPQNHGVASDVMTTAIAELSLRL